MRLLVLTAALALPAAIAAQPAPEYQPRGEVLFRIAGGVSTGASFDEERIIGPVVNLSQSEGGTWIGDFGGNAVDLEVSDERVTGNGVDLHVKRQKKKLLVQGNLLNRRVRIEVGEKEISGRAGDCSFDLDLKSPGRYAGNIGCTAGARIPQTGRAEILLEGAAAQPSPPMPQFALALVSVLPL